MYVLYFCEKLPHLLPSTVKWTNFIYKGHYSKLFSFIKVQMKSKIYAFSQYLCELSKHYKIISGGNFFFSHLYEIFWAWKWRGELFTFIYSGCAWLDYRVKKDKHEWIHLWGKNKFYFYLFRKMKIFPIMLERVFFLQPRELLMGRSFCHSSNGVPLIAAISQIKWMISVCILTNFVKVGECVWRKIFFYMKSIRIAHMPQPTESMHTYKQMHA